MVESEQVLVSNINRDQIQAAAHIIIKGKRTKRQRPHSPLSLAAASCSSSAAGPDEGDAAPTTPTTTDDFTTYLDSTEEDQDMAHCLILLAQGHHLIPKTPLPPPSPTQPTHCVYQCRTCDRCFPSFQALGGHRASHKKPRIAAADDKKKLAPPPSRDEEEEEGFRFRLQFHGNSTPAALSLKIGNNNSSSNNNNNNNNNNNRTGSSSSSVLATPGKPRVHECAICGAEFTSGQALGGHMRRHRSFTGGPPSAASRSPGGGGGCRAESSSHEDARKSRSVLPLDLNLPAPEDHDHHHRQPEAKLIAFEPKETSLLFSSSSLVDCHY